MVMMLLHTISAKAEVDIDLQDKRMKTKTNLLVSL